jgi:hypothetical protein
MQDLPKNLPVDAAEYLVSAAEEVANEQGFKPASPEELRVWLKVNTEAVVERAKALQIDLLNKLESPEGKKVKELISIKVWTEIRRRELVRESNAALRKVLDY